MVSPETLIFLGVLFIWLLGGKLGGYVAAQKGRPESEGWKLALLFGPLGVIVEAMLPDQGS